MGLEEHLLTMFREDFEFHDDAGASHHGGQAKPRPDPEPANTDAPTGQIIWLDAAEKELRKVPFFVRGKARRNTEHFAAERGVSQISVETLYEAKAHYAR